MLRRHTILSLLIFVLASTVSIRATSNCEQTFDLIGKTANDACRIAFTESLSGECLDTTYFVLIFVAGSQTNNPPYVRRMKSPVDSSVKVAAMEPFNEIKGDEGRFFISDSVWFEAPPQDSFFYPKLVSIIRDRAGSGASSWYYYCDTACADFPVFSGAEAELLYFHQRGLYKNYTISKAYYWPESKYLLIITDQPTRAVGLDTMHGVLVYRLK